MYMIVHVHVHVCTEVEITVKHQTIPDNLACLSERISLCSDISSLQKNKYDKKE